MLTTTASPLQAANTFTETTNMGNITVHAKTHGFGDTFIEIQYKGHPLFTMTDEDARELKERLNEHYNNNL